MTLTRRPRVSVHMPAFNHEAYIGEALDSVLAQETRFDYEIVIGEDRATDGTLAVAKAYASRFPAKINLIENDVNLGIWQNDQVIIAACRGEFIAWLESDDFWTSPSKLQRQVDFLDGHPDHSACFTRATCLTESEPPITWKGAPGIVQQDYTVDDLLEQGHFIPSCTAVFRAHLVRPALGWTRGTSFLETAYAIRFALAGKIGFIDEPCSYKNSLCFGPFVRCYTKLKRRCVVMKRFIIRSRSHTHQHYKTALVCFRKHLNFRIMCKFCV